jgi:hypothetical protein
MRDSSFQSSTARKLIQKAATKLNINHAVSKCIIQVNEARTFVTHLFVEDYVGLSTDQKFKTDFVVAMEF